MSAADSFQNTARAFAISAAKHLREAATKLEETFPEVIQPSDTMRALEILRTGVHCAEISLAHASHNHALAVLHKERERS